MALTVTIACDEYRQLVADSEDKASVIKLLKTEFPDDTCQLIAVKSLLNIEEETEDDTTNDDTTDTTDTSGTSDGGDTVDGSVSKKVKDGIDDFATKISDDGTINTFKELIDYAASHTAEFSELSGEVQANTTAIATINGPETEAGSFKKAVKDEETRAKGVEEGLDGRIEDLEAKFDGEGSVESQIATAKSEAIAAAKTETETQVNALANGAVKANTDGLASLKQTVDSFTFATDADIRKMFEKDAE